MLHYYKFKEGAPHPIGRHDDEGVAAEDVEVQGAREAELESLIGLPETERLQRVRKMDLPTTYEEEKWREIRDVVPAEVFDVMHNEAVQRQIKSGQAWNEKQTGGLESSTDPAGRANETFDTPAADDEAA